MDVCVCVCVCVVWPSLVAPLNSSDLALPGNWDWHRSLVWTSGASRDPRLKLVTTSTQVIPGIQTDGPAPRKLLVQFCVARRDGYLI